MVKLSSRPSGPTSIDERRNGTHARQTMQCALAGNVVFTIASKRTGTRFTFKVQAAETGVMHFVKVLTGGQCDDNKISVHSPRRLTSTRGDKARSRGCAERDAFDRFWPALAPSKLDRSRSTTRANCGRCGRALPPGIRRFGYGPECVTKRNHTLKWINVIDNRRNTIPIFWRQTNAELEKAALSSLVPEYARLLVRRKITPEETARRIIELVERRGGTKVSNPDRLLREAQDHALGPHRGPRPASTPSPGRCTAPTARPMAFGRASFSPSKWFAMRKTKANQTQPPTGQLAIPPGARPMTQENPTTRRATAATPSLRRRHARRRRDHCRASHARPGQRHGQGHAGDGRRRLPRRLLRRIAPTAHGH